ncbi:Poly [ADP-ribose] polymerase 3 [Forsythia ovata]|uniref:Poly [ADP-ribose] polymerase 3 n=1 Tax=Forsythia ovata TaxID=205694 RepID=A0ABD1VFL5_9LAMI
MKVQETRSNAHSSGHEEKMVTRKQKAEGKAPESEQSPKKAKTEGENDQTTGKSTADIKAEFEKFCKETRFYSEWSTCTYTTLDPPRKDEPLKLPESVEESAIADFLKKHQDPKPRLQRASVSAKKPFKGMMISLSGRLSRTHQFWKSKIEKHGGKVTNSVIGATCLVASPAERDRGGSLKLAEALERGIPVVREAWLSDSIEKKEAQPLDVYDIASDIVVAGRGIPLDKQDESEEALETITAELKIYGKRGVHKDTKLQNEGGQILEKDGILYNCAFTCL